MDFVEWSGKGAERPLAYATINRTFYSEFLYDKPMETHLFAGQRVEQTRAKSSREQMIRLMSVFAEVFFLGQWNPDSRVKSLNPKF